MSDVGRRPPVPAERDVGRRPPVPAERDVGRRPPVPAAGGRNPLSLLVLGAHGMLGGRVVRCARAAGHDVVAPGRTEADITDAQALAAAVRSASPQAVINCAAWTDVDGAEAEEAAALLVNGEGAGNVAAAAAAAGARVVHISSDYVFDGSKRSPWVESDRVAPLGAYGRTKLAGERAVQSACGDHAIVRTAWLFGAGGGNFVDTMLRLGDERDEVSVVTDQVGCPTWTGHLAPALVELAAGTATGTFHVAGAGACSWHELCVEAFRVAGVDCAVRETTSAAFPRPAPRPAYSVLGTERDDAPRLPAWQAGVAAHLRERVPA